MGLTNLKIIIQFWRRVEKARKVIEAMAQHGLEARPAHRLIGALTLGLDERHPPLSLGGKPLYSPLGLFQSRL